MATVANWYICFFQSQLLSPDFSIRLQYYSFGKFNLPSTKVISVPRYFSVQFGRKWTLNKHSRSVKLISELKMFGLIHQKMRAKEIDAKQKEKHSSFVTRIKEIFALPVTVTPTGNSVSIRFGSAFEAIGWIVACKKLTSTKFMNAIFCHLKAMPLMLPIQMPYHVAQPNLK